MFTDSLPAAVLHTDVLSSETVICDEFKHSSLAGRINDTVFAPNNSTRKLTNKNQILLYSRWKYSMVPRQHNVFNITNGNPAMANNSDQPT